MSMIPQVEPCRFMTIAQIRQRIEDDAFQYNSVRVVAKVQSYNPQQHKAIVEDPNDPKQIIQVDSYLLKGKLIEMGKMYEFLGEIEQLKESKEETEEDGGNKENQHNVNMNDESPDLKVYLKARILKQSTGFHKLVYNASSL